MTKREVAILIFSGISGIIIGSWIQYHKVVKDVLKTAAQTNVGFAAKSGVQLQKNIDTWKVYLQGKGIDTTGMTDADITSEGYDQSTGDTIFISAHPELFQVY